MEAALIIGLTLGLLVKMKRAHLAPVVWLGVVVAIALSLGAALALYGVGATLTGQAEEIFVGVTMFLATGVLTWMIFWMQRQGRQVKAGLEADVRHAAGHGRTWGLFGITCVAVLREGIETVLCLTAAFTATAQATLVGGLAGRVMAAVLGWALFAATVRLDVRRFFQVTGFLLILFAAGLVAHSVHEFNEAGLIPEVVEHLWNLNPILNEKSAFGLMLTASFGYNGNPSLTEVVAYAGYYLALWVGLRFAMPARRMITVAVNKG